MAFGPRRTTIVVLAAVVLVGCLSLQVVAGELLWGPSLTAAGMLVLGYGHLAAWRRERRLHRDRLEGHGRPSGD